MEELQTLDDYVLGPLLGVGYKTTVRIGTKDGVQWAVKYIEAEQEESELNRLKFLVTNERDVMLNLKHDHILKLHDSSLTGTLRSGSKAASPAMYLVFELMKPFDLHDVIDRTGAFSETVARYYFQHLLSAVEHMHTQGYIHRDIKLMNVLIDAHYDPKLADFGTACFLPPGAKTLGKIGTLSIIPPEASGSVPYDGVKADLFALGVLLFTLVMGQPPFRQVKSENYRAFYTQNRIFWAQFASIKTFSDDFKAIINSLLAVKPENRPSIAQIKETPWYQGPSPTSAEVQAHLSAREPRVLERKTHTQAGTSNPTQGEPQPMVAGFQPHATCPVM